MKQNRKYFILLLILLINVTTTGLAKSYKIGCFKDYEPYIIVDRSGDLEGVIIDWWKLWSKKTGIEIEFVELNIQDCIEKVKTGEIDIIAGMFYSDERAETLDFSEPIMRLKTALYLKKDIKVDSVKNIDRIIGVVEGDLAQTYLQANYPNIELKVFKSYSTLRETIYAQNIDGFVYDIPNPIGNFKKPAPPEGYYMLEALFAERLRPAIKKGNVELANLIVSGSNKITDEERIEIAEEWELFKENKTYLWWIIGITGASIGIIVVLIFFIYKNRKQSILLSDFESRTDWQVIIDKGENDLIEFKSSLRWDYKQEKVNKALELVIIKTISAFLNSEGGMLFIGVDDDGNTLGLENDYKTTSKKNSDGFLLTLTNLINQNLGKSTHKFISINIIAINETDVCIVSVEKSDKPVFMGRNENEEFYIRASASSQPLGLKEAYSYIRSHWQT